MRMISRQKTLFRNYERALFHNKEHSKSERLYAFYLLMLPVVEFLKEQIKVYGMEPDEIESEIYLLCADLFEQYDVTKSSIIPYLEKQIPWRIKKMFLRLDKKLLIERPVGLTVVSGENYTINECFYWEKILFEDGWVGKCFTTGQKYLIYKILEADDKNLSINALAKACNTERRIMKRLLLDLKEAIQSEEI